MTVEIPQLIEYIFKVMGEESSMESKHIKADSVQQLTTRLCTPVYQETLQLEMNSVNFM